MSRTTVIVAADWAPIRAFEPIVRTAPEAVYGDLLPALRAADLRIVNCECALTRATRPVWKSGSVFKGEPGDVRGLTVVPFDVACLANNHVLDYGVAGLRETLHVLHRNAIRTVGAGLTETEAYQPLTVTVNGTRVHIVNFGEGEDLTAASNGPGVFGWEIDRAASAVARCHARGGVVIAIGHCGLEYVPSPPPYVADAFRTLLSAGADCVIGHHPHVPQGVEWHDGRPIVYSLGNFVFYQPTDLYWRHVGFCVTLEFEKGTLADAELIPYHITETGLRRLDTNAHREFARTLQRLSRPLRTMAGTMRAWHAYLEYYGTAGFANEVLAILDKMKTEPEKGAAMFRNRITTMQHRELWCDFLTWVMEGRTPRATPQMRATIEEWFGRQS